MRIVHWASFVNVECNSPFTVFPDHAHSELWALAQAQLQISSHYSEVEKFCKYKPKRVLICIQFTICLLPFKNKERMQQKKKIAQKLRTIQFRMGYCWH